MPLRPRLLLFALGLVAALLAGCTDSSPARNPGDPVTQDEAQVLAELLHKNFERGGAHFVESAPYGEGTVLTLTGDIDFTRSIAQAEAVTKFTDGRPDDSRSMFWTPDDLWFGKVPGLSAALAAHGLPDAQYVRRPMIKTAGSGAASLIDVLPQLMLNLAKRTGDDPRAFLQNGYTWQGQQSINGRLASVYGLPGGVTVAVSASDKLLVQYVTPLPDQDFKVTITLSDQAPQHVELPADNQTVDATNHPEIASELGV